MTLQRAGKFSPLRREPAYLKVYRVIEQNIIDGVLADGEALPIEAELCRQFQVTRSTVREGLRLLEQSGLIVRGARKKFLVKRPSSADVAQSASRSLALGGVTFNEVWDALYTFYPPAARLAAERVRESDVEDLAAIRARLAEGDKRNHDNTVNCAVAFFDTIVEGLDNKVMVALLASLNLMIGESLRQVVNKAPDARARILAAQKNIIQGLSDRDGELVEKWMARHIADLRRGYIVAEVDMDQAIL